MTLGTIGKRLAAAVLGVLVLALLLGAILGQPVLVSFVETGSMEPTLEPGDGFVPIPAAIAGPIDSGDVVVFRAQNLHGGGLVTHRVVGETASGYVTQGDANAFTDQSGSEPPVKDAQIVAVALTFQGDVVVLPNLGTSLEAVGSASGYLKRTASTAFGFEFNGGQGFAVTVLVVMIAWYCVEVWRERTSTDPDRERSRETAVSGHMIVLAMTAIIVFGATFAMVGPSGTTEYAIISAEFDEPGARIIPTGQTESAKHPVGNGGVVPVVVFFETSDERIDIQPRRTELGGQQVKNATLTVTAPPQTGQYHHFVTEYRYLAVLPTDVLADLYAVHPWLPVVVIDLLVAGPYYLVGIRLLGTNSVRLTNRGRGKPFAVRFRERLRGLY